MLPQPTLRNKPPSRRKRGKNGQQTPSPQRVLALRWPPGQTKESPWRDGGRLPYLGRTIELVLAAADEVRLEDDRLLLPLPPGATAQQVQDAAEAWLQRQAHALFARLAGDHGLEVVLAFGREQEPVRRDGSRLRCQWRLIALPPPVIEQLFRRFFANETAPAADGLFGPP